MPLRRVEPGTFGPEAFERWDPLEELYSSQNKALLHKRAQDLSNESIREPNPGAGRFAQPRLLRKPEEYENIENGRIRKQDISARSGTEPRFAGAMPSGYWGKDPAWRQLSSYEKAAAMALLEADSVNGRPDFGSARNVLGAMINRADKGGEDLGEHVSQRIYQPTIEPAQYRRLQAIVEMPEFKALTGLAERRDTGEVEDWVNGATHFLAHEPVMEGLREQEPNKYKSWVGWSGYNRGGGEYSNPDGSPVLRDRSHAFLAPEGRHSANRGPLVDVERQHTVPSELEPPQEAPSLTASGRPGGRMNVEVATETSNRIPKLSEVLGFKRLGTGEFKNPIVPEALSAQLPSLTPMALPEQDQAAFQISQRQRRPMLPDPSRRA